MAAKIDKKMQDETADSGVELAVVKNDQAYKQDNKLAAARAKNLDLAIQQIQKDFGEGAIIRMGD